MGMVASAWQFLDRRWRTWTRFYNRRDTYACVDVDDPVSCALADTQLLLAFAAQSSRKIEAKKVETLTHAAEAFRLARLNHLATDQADKASAFWIAFDDFAAELAPLSACSIRSSIEVNARCFPKSLMTPTTGNACCAVIVFAVGLALQGFWVSGKDLLDMGSGLQLKTAELSALAVAKQAEVETAQHRYEALRFKLGELENCRTQLVRLPTALTPPVDNALLKASCADFMAAITTLEEKRQYALHAERALTALVDNGLPITILVTQWYDRATSICGKHPLNVFCPVRLSTDQGVASSSLLVERLTRELEAPLVLTPASSGVLSAPTGFQQRLLLRAKLLEAQIEHGKAREAQFASIMMQSKMISANVGTYLIPMLMGVLGSLTFILRSLSQSLRDHTYTPNSVSLYIVRICLGAIAGVFSGLLASSGEPGFKALSLPPLFVPFVSGYGIEILFALLDRVVRTFTQPETGRAQRE